MADEGAPVHKQKELETLSQTSLILLARGLSKDPDGLMFPMLLNLPTTTIVNLIHDYNEKGLINDESGAGQAEVLEKCVLMWKEQTADHKNKDRVKTLEKVLREMGKHEVADALLERYQNHQEITLDIFD